MDTIATRISETLILKGMKQSELARQTGISKGTLSSYISGAYEPKQKNLARIANTLQVSESWLMGIETPQETACEAPDNWFPFRVKGDAMEPKISDGDLLIVRRQDTVEDGDIVLAQIPDSKTVCKRFRRYAEGIMLISTNQKYDPLLFTNQELMDHTVEILGKVVELRAKL